MTFRLSVSSDGLRITTTTFPKIYATKMNYLSLNRSVVRSVGVCFFRDSISFFNRYAKFYNSHSLVFFLLRRVNRCRLFIRARWIITDFSFAFQNLELNFYGRKKTIEKKNHNDIAKVALYWLHWFESW